MKKRFMVLDSWRGIAASCVVLFHLHVLGSVTESDAMRGAWLFVPFFFLLSGFVLMHSYGPHDKFKPVGMMRKRVLRLWPLHLVMLGIFIIFELGKLAAQQFGIEFNFPAFEAQNAASEIIPNALLVQSWLREYNALSFNYPAWSISVEFGMYVILASVLFFIHNEKQRVITFAVIALGGGVLLISGLDGNLRLAQAGIFAFSLGVILQYAYKHTVKFLDLLPTWYFTLVEMFAFVLIYIALTTELRWPYVQATLLFVPVIYIFTFEGGVISWLLKLKPFQKLGEWSYSIYMTHAALIFVLTVVTQVTHHGSVMAMTTNAGLPQLIRFFDTGNIWINQSLPFIILGMVWVISSQTYKYIEVPGQKLFKK